MTSSTCHRHCGSCQVSDRYTAGERHSMSHRVQMDAPQAGSPDDPVNIDYGCFFDCSFYPFDCFISLISLISLNHIVSHIVLDLQAVKFKLPVWGNSDPSSCMLSEEFSSKNCITMYSLPKQGSRSRRKLWDQTGRIPADLELKSNRTSHGEKHV